jgi:hypothetical protein
MWGIRATRVVCLLAGILATVASAGCCCDCCKNLWKSDNPAPTSTSQPTAQAKGDDKDAEKVLSDWKRPWFKDQPTHLKPEQIHGGIY